PALALPVPDGVLHELERAVLAQVRYGKDALEDGLQPGVLPLARQDAHLQEALVGVLLDLDEIGDRNRGIDLRKVDTVPVDVLGSRIHLLSMLPGRSGTPPCKKGHSEGRHVSPEAGDRNQEL